MTDDLIQHGIQHRTEPRSLADFGRDLLGTLERVKQLGVRWRNTRFERYARALNAIAEYQATPSQGGLHFEAMNQGAQLVSAVTLADVVGRDVLAAKMKVVMSGGDLPPPDGADDAPRNALFELTVADQLWSLGFCVGVTAAAEDVRASHPSLPNFAAR